MNDPLGLGLAEAVNDYLPPDIRILSVQRAPWSFDARKACKSREYEFAVPGWLLDLSRASPAKHADVAKQFNLIMSRFIGRHPFHNFTKHSYYRQRKTEGCGDADSELYIQTELPVGVLRATPGPFNSRPSWLKDENQVISFVCPHTRAKTFLWTNCMGLKIPHMQTLYRRVKSVDCFVDSSKVGTGDEPVLLIRVTGDSFLFNQIRHMVAFAVSIFKNELPAELVNVSLSESFSLYGVPLMPAGCLTLRNCILWPRIDLNLNAKDLLARRSLLDTMRTHHIRANLGSNQPHWQAFLQESVAMKTRFSPQAVGQMIDLLHLG